MTEEIKETIEETEATDMNQVDIEKLVNWTDEECEAFDKEHHIPVKEYRDILNRFRTLVQDFNTLFIQHDQIKTLLVNGDVIGYTVACPKCNVTYNVKTNDLNYNTEITCQDCGEKYIQNKNIIGLYVREEVVNEENK